MSTFENYLSNFNRLRIMPTIFFRFVFFNYVKLLLAFNVQKIVELQIKCMTPYN